MPKRSKPTLSESWHSATISSTLSSLPFAGKSLIVNCITPTCSRVLGAGRDHFSDERHHFTEAFVGVICEERRKLEAQPGGARNRGDERFDLFGAFTGLTCDRELIEDVVGDELDEVGRQWLAGPHVPATRYGEDRRIGHVEFLGTGRGRDSSVLHVHFGVGHPEDRR